MFDLKIRYNRWVAYLQFGVTVIFFLVSLNLRSWLSVTVDLMWGYSAYVALTMAMLEIKDSKIIVKNSLGITTHTCDMSIQTIEVVGQKILADNKKIYKYSFLYQREDFDRVKAFLQNKLHINLEEHLINEEI